MEIHMDDLRTHVPPPGWHWFGEQPYRYTDTTEIWLLRRGEQQ